MRICACFRFYEELNDFLPPGKRKASFTHCRDRDGSVEVWIRELGVPPSAVDLVLVNGVSADLSRVVAEGDRISVYPVFESVDIGPAARIAGRPLRRNRFVSDPQVRRLAWYLRLLGFDTLCRGSPTAEGPPIPSPAPGRIALTRRPDLLSAGLAVRAVRVGPGRPRTELLRVLSRLQLWTSVRPFSRCLACNAPLAWGRALRSGAGEGARNPEPQACPACGRVYRDGARLRRCRWLVATLTRAGRSGSGGGPEP